MDAVIFLWVIAVAWLVINGVLADTPSNARRRKRATLSWAFVGACAGSLVGLAGLAPALVGAIPGAVVAYLIASRMLQRRADPDA